MTLKRWLQLIGSFALSGVFIWWALRGVDFSRLAESMRTANYLYLVPAIGCWTAIQYIRVWRFRYLAAPLVLMPFSALFRIGNIGMMAVLILPVRLGEFVRPYLMKREYGFGMSSGLGPVAAERVVDGLVVTIGFFLVTRLGLQVPPAMENAGLGALLLFVSAAFVLGLVLIGHEKGAELLRRMIGVVSPRLADRIVTMVQGFGLGLRGLAKPRTAVLYVFWTFCVWGLNGVANWVQFYTFDIHQSISTGFVLVALTVIAVMIPAGPGFVGTYQFAVVEGLGLLGVDRNVAFAYSILTHFSSLAVTLAFGLFSLLHAHLSMATIVRDSQTATD